MFRGVALVASACLLAAAVSAAVPASAANVITPPEVYPNAHAHNDYLNDSPLTGALGHGFTSIEADVFLDQDGVGDPELALCHGMDGEQCESDVSWPHDGSVNSDIPKRFLDETYLSPLMNQVAANNGRVYANYSGPVYLVIEIKCQETGPEGHKVCADRGVPDRAWAEIRRELVRYQSAYGGPGQLFSTRTGTTPQRGAVDVVITGGHNEDSGSTVGDQLRDPSVDQIARLDGSLSRPGTAGWNTAMISFGWSPGDTCDYDASGISGRVKDIVAAHDAGYVTRVYGEPDCPHRHDTSSPGVRNADYEAQQDAWSYLYNQLHCALTYLSSDHLELLPDFLDQVHWAEGCPGGGSGGGGTGSGPVETGLTYTGPVTAEYHHPFTVTARLGSGDGPVVGAAVGFSLGQSGSCTAVTDSAGVAGCLLTPNEAAGQVGLRIRFSGNDSYAPSELTVPFTITPERTVLTYTGTAHLANGTSAHLVAALTADDGSAVAGRPVGFTLGTGGTAQTCQATTDATGAARCDIASVSQPLTESATVPLAARFAGDQFYLPSEASAALRLEYMTGRAYGLAATLPLADVQPMPDTGTIRTAFATASHPPCTAALNAIALSAAALCPKVTTTIAPGSVTATSTVSDVSIGLLGLPVIEISGVTATSASDCTSATGEVQITVHVAGQPITVPIAPNSAVDLPGGLRLVVDEQLPVPDADHGLAVIAAHLTAPGVDVVIGAASSAAHNCT